MEDEPGAPKRSGPAATPKPAESQGLAVACPTGSSSPVLADGCRLAFFVARFEADKRLDPQDDWMHPCRHTSYSGTQNCGR